MVEALEWFGCATGLAGALLLAMNTKWSAWGWIAFLASNAAWIGFAAAKQAPGLLIQQLGFTATSLLGLYRWRKALARTKGS